MTDTIKHKQLGGQSNLKYKIIFIAYVLINLTLSIVRHCTWEYVGDGFEWPNAEMCMSYKYGFVRRGLMGTVALKISEIFNIDRFAAVKGIQLAGEIIFCTLIVVLICYFIRSCKNETKQNIIMLISAVFLQLGGFGFYLYDWGEPDIYMVSLVIMSVLLIMSDKCVFLVIPLSCLCEMIHEGYIMMFFPVVFALLFFRMSREENKTKKKKYFAVLFLTTLFTAGLFIYFYFFSVPVTEFTSKEALDEIKTIYNKKMTPNLSDNVKYIWFGADNYALPLWEKGKPTPVFYQRMKSLIKNTVIALPSLMCFFIIWFSRAKNFKNNRHKLAELVMFSAIAVVLPLFILHSDLTRWCYDVIFYEFVILAVLVITDGDNTVKLFEENKLINNRIIQIVFVLYLCFATYFVRFNKWRIFDLNLILKMLRFLFK